jgi:hypothetical protein
MWKQYFIGLAVSVAALYLFFQTTSLNELADALSGMDPRWLLPSTLLLALGFFLRAVRWRVLMRPVGQAPLSLLFDCLMVGFLANNILPAHLGELVRAYTLGKRTEYGFSGPLATVVLERIYDGLTVLLMLLLVLLFLDMPEGAVSGSHLSLESLRWGGWTGLLLFAGLLVLLQFFRWQRGRSLKILASVLRFLPDSLREKVLASADSFAQGLAVSRLSDLVQSGLYSLAVWVVYSFWAWSLLPAFGLDLGFWSGVLVEVVLALALIIPAAPGFVGTFHVAGSASLIFLGVPGPVAASYAMMLWLIHFVFTVVVGLICLWRLGLGWSALTGRDRKGA